MARRTFDPIERLGVNAVEAAVLAMGHIWREQPVDDYGIDGQIEIVGDDQRPTGQLVGVQVKSGPSFFSRAGDLSVPFYISQEHWEYWSTHSLPIIVVLHDEATGRTVWEWVTPETAADAGTSKRLDVPLQRWFGAMTKEQLRYHGPVYGAAARRQRFALDIGIMRALSGQPEAYITFEMWINKSLTFRGAEIRFEEPEKSQPDLTFPWMMASSDIAEIAWVLFPWLSLDQLYSVENHSGEVDEHVFSCSLNEAGKAFLVLEGYFQDAVDVPPVPTSSEEAGLDEDWWGEAK